MMTFGALVLVPVGFQGIIGSHCTYMCANEAPSGVIMPRQKEKDHQDLSFDEGSIVLFKVLKQVAQGTAQPHASNWCALIWRER